MYGSEKAQHAEDKGEREPNDLQGEMDICSVYPLMLRQERYAISQPNLRSFSEHADIYSQKAEHNDYDKSKCPKQ